MNQHKFGIIFSYVSIGVNTILEFVYAPMLLLFVGKDKYGIYQLV
jgi:hypothetical protein